MIKRKLCAMLLACSMLFTAVAPAYATEETVATETKQTLTVKVGDDGLSVPFNDLDVTTTTIGAIKDSISKKLSDTFATYTYLSYNGKTLTDTETLKAAEIPDGATLILSDHEHTWEFTATGPILTATADNTCNKTVSITLSATSQAYTGESVTASFEGTKEWTDAGLIVPEIGYYKDGSTTKLESAPKDPGTYTASSTVTYTSVADSVTGETTEKTATAEATYKIQTEIGDVTLDQSSYIADGQYKTPTVIVKATVDGTTKTLTQDTDYKLSGDTTASELGTYTITVTGTGDYAGEKTVNWTITDKAGTVTKSAKCESSSIITKAALSTSVDTLKKASGILTTEDNTKIAAGTNANIYITVTGKKVTEVEDDDRTAIKKAAATALGTGASVGYIDISLYKQLGDENAVQITDPGESLTIALTLSSSVINTSSTKTRTYKIIRMHDGEATAIACSFNKSTKVLTFKSDKFSTYALAYKDTTTSSSSSSSSSSSGTTSTSGTTTTKTTTPTTTTTTTNTTASSTPETGDNSHMMLWVTLMLISFGMMCVSVGVEVADIRKRRR